MEPTSNDPSIASAPFDNLSTMIRALAGATDPAERTLYIRGIARALEFVTGKTHEALEAFVQAVASPRPPPAVKKIDVLRGLMAAGDWPGALRVASKFDRLGDEGPAIMQAWEALSRPEWCKSLGRDPTQLIAAGIAALQRRYPAAKGGR